MVPSSLDVSPYVNLPVPPNRSLVEDNRHRRHGAAGSQGKTRGGSAPDDTKADLSLNVGLWPKAGPASRCAESLAIT